MRRKVPFGYVFEVSAGEIIDIVVSAGAAITAAGLEGQTLELIDPSRLRFVAEPREQLLVLDIVFANPDDHHNLTVSGSSGGQYVLDLRPESPQVPTGFVTLTFDGGTESTGPRFAKSD